jgi:hypothetical protein
MLKYCNIYMSQLPMSSNPNGTSSHYRNRGKVSCGRDPLGSFLTNKATFICFIVFVSVLP